MPDRSIRDLLSEAEMTAAESFRLEGEIRVLKRLLCIKFGVFPCDYLRRLEAATPAQIKRYTAQFVTAQSIAEVFAEPS